MSMLAARMLVAGVDAVSVRVVMFMKLAIITIVVEASPVTVGKSWRIVAKVLFLESVRAGGSRADLSPWCRGSIIKG